MVWIFNVGYYREYSARPPKLPFPEVGSIWIISTKVSIGSKVSRKSKDLGKVKRGVRVEILETAK